MIRVKELAFLQLLLLFRNKDISYNEGGEKDG